jgi:hypothetical protein
MKNLEPISSTSLRDPKRMSMGKIVFYSVLEKGADVTALVKQDVADACFYLDAHIFLPAGGLKAARSIREQAKKWGLR